MSVDAEIETFLRCHLDSIFANNLAEYHVTTAEDLTLYEWCFTAVAPHRLHADGPDRHTLTANPAIRQN